jgi:hypothetical protein
MKRSLFVSSLFAAASLSLLSACTETASTTAPEIAAGTGAPARILSIGSGAIAAITSTGEFGDQYADESAFDGSNSTHWVSNKSPISPSAPAALMVRYVGPSKILSYTISSRFDTLKNRLPKSWILQGTTSATATVTDAAGDAAWTTLDEQVSQVAGQQWNSSTFLVSRTFPIGTPGSYLAYRLVVREVNGSDAVDIFELGMDASEGFVATSNGDYSSGYSADKAFNGSDVGYYDHWISTNHASFQGPANLQITYDHPRTFGKYTIRGRYDVLKDRLPRTWILQGSNSGSAVVTDPVDAAAWTTVTSHQNIGFGTDPKSSWAKTEGSWLTSMTFDLPAGTTYSRYRLCVTAVNGSTVVDIFEVVFQP